MPRRYEGANASAPNCSALEECPADLDSFSERRRNQEPVEAHSAVFERTPPFPSKWPPFQVALYTIALILPPPFPSKWPPFKVALLTIALMIPPPDSPVILSVLYPNPPVSPPANKGVLDLED